MTQSSSVLCPVFGESPPMGEFLATIPVEPEQPATQINVVLNWFEELKRRVPTQ